MKAVYYIIILLALAPPVLILSFGNEGLLWFQQSPAHSEQAEVRQDRQYREKVDEGLAVYTRSYNREIKVHQREIIEQWGEFKDPATSVWVSYGESDQVRRSVDFSTGEVEVEMLVDKGTKPSDVRQQLDEAVFRLMNTTEKDAFESDVVAKRVEQSLTDYQEQIQQAELSDDRLFSIDDLVSIQINHSGYFKVSVASAGNLAVTDIRSALKKDKDIIRVSFKVPHSIHQKAARYAAAVMLASEKENISDELLFAIMETESSFNPMAKSHVPAYGLMQIVPHTAGKDATRYLYGKPKILAPSFLYKPDNNIAIGAAYLHILHYKYMRRIRDPKSRMYCAIAAYNTGASNVAKAFIDKASFTRAVPVINRLGPEEVYDKLRKFLPREETRRYIEKVATRMEKYL